MSGLWLVAIGGAAGSVLRHLVAGRLNPAAGFPIGTWTVSSGDLPSVDAITR